VKCRMQCKEDDPNCCAARARNASFRGVRIVAGRLKPSWQAHLVNRPDCLHFALHGEDMR
jgi:hypothetical protein